MAKKRTTTTYTTTTSNYPIVKATAFWGIIISGIVGLINFIISILVKFDIIKGAGGVVGRVLSAMNLIAQIALFISVFLAGWAHSRGKSQVWRTLFWVFVVLAILGILGVNLLAMF